MITCVTTTFPGITATASAFSLRARTPLISHVFKWPSRSSREHRSLVRVHLYVTSQFRLCRQASRSRQRYQFVKSLRQPLLKITEPMELDTRSVLFPTTTRQHFSISPSSPSPLLRSLRAHSVMCCLTSKRMTACTPRKSAEEGMRRIHVY